jgi:hypothetical protein
VRIAVAFKKLDQHLMAGVASSVELTPNFGLGGKNRYRRKENDSNSE